MSTVEPPSSRRPGPPPSTGLAATPASWYYLGPRSEVDRGPVRFDLPGGQSFVGYRTVEGQCVVLSNRCSHMGAYLSSGSVHGRRISCPLHGWQYGPEGVCEHIPATSEIPSCARQTRFPVEERGGHLLFYNRPQAPHPLPFFEGVEPSHLRAASSFEFIIDAPWHVVSGNVFDAQHFRCAHDRTLVGDFQVDGPHPLARRVRANFTVSGTSLQDRLVRRFSGADVHMAVTVWAGPLILVTATFRRTTSYGLVSLIPLEDGRTRLRDIVWIPRRKGFVGRNWIDPVDLAIRRIFIREFVRSDVDRSHGISFNRAHAIPADHELVAYVDWLEKIHLQAPGSS